MSKYVSRVSPGDCELITPKEFYARQGKEKKLKKRMEREPVVDTFGRAGHPKSGIPFSKVSGIGLPKVGAK